MNPTLQQTIFQSMVSGRDRMTVNVKYKRAKQLLKWDVPLLLGGNAWVKYEHKCGAIEY